MPRYDAKCLKCGDEFEVEKKMSDPMPQFHYKINTDGSECMGPVEQILTPTPIAFRGKGWYVTDYGKGK